MNLSEPEKLENAVDCAVAHTHDNPGCLLWIRALCQDARGTPIMWVYAIGMGDVVGEMIVGYN